MKIFSNVIDAYRHYSCTKETCAAVYPYDARALYLTTTRRQQSVVLYKDGKDIRFVIERVGA